ncbi:MAG TPA: hypothetical protein VF798_03450 [Burkholderiaceae bacterium]
MTGKWARAALAAALLHGSAAWASGGPPMFTDDAGTPGDGHWEINLATLSFRTASADTYQLPLIDLNYGIGERTQLKLEMPLIRQNDPSGTQSGLGNGLFGVRWRFYDAGEDGWQISTYPQLQFAPSPSAAHRGLAAPGAATLLPLEFVHGFDGGDINLEVGRWVRPAGQGDSWIAGLVFTHEVKTGFEVMAELHEERAVNSAQQELIANVGTRRDLSENVTLLVSAGRDLHNTLSEKNNFLSYLGLQLRF